MINTGEKIHAIIFYFHPEYMLIFNAILHYIIYYIFKFCTVNYTHYLCIYLLGKLQLVLFSYYIVFTPYGLCNYCTVAQSSIYI